MSKEVADITFGTQLDRATERHTFYTQFFWKKQEIGKIFPDLIGHEHAMVSALGKVVVERIDTMTKLGSAGLAAEIVEARRYPHGRKAKTN